MKVADQAPLAAEQEERQSDLCANDDTNLLSQDRGDRGEDAGRPRPKVPPPHIAFNEEIAGQEGEELLLLVKPNYVTSEYAVRMDSEQTEGASRQSLATHIPRADTIDEQSGSNGE